MSIYTQQMRDFGKCYWNIWYIGSLSTLKFIDIWHKFIDGIVTCQNKWLYMCRGWVCFVVISAYDRSFEYYIK